MTGRPTKLVPDTVKKLTDAIKLGSTYEHACAYAGISYASFRGWMRKGEAAKSGEYFNFFNAIKKAEADAVVMSLAEIKKASQGGTWQASAWLLERRYPENYGRHVQTTEHTGEIKNVNVQVYIPDNGRD